MDGRRACQGRKQGVVPGTSLAVQWLGLRASTAGSSGLIPGQGTKIVHGAWPTK